MPATLTTAISRIELPFGKKSFIKKLIVAIAHAHDRSVKSGGAGQSDKETRYIITVAGTSRENIAGILVQLQLFFL